MGRKSDKTKRYHQTAKKEPHLGVTSYSSLSLKVSIFLIPTLVGMLVYFFLKGDFLSYKKAVPTPPPNITNAYDMRILLVLEDLEVALKNLSSPSEIVTKSTHLLEKYPESPRLTFIRAEALNRLSDIKKSNTLLKESIEVYERTLERPNLLPDLERLVVTKLVDRQQFMGMYSESVRALRGAISRHPVDLTYQNLLGVALLLQGDTDEARRVFLRVSTLPGDHNQTAIALLHLGFIIKTIDRDYEEATRLLEKGFQLLDEKNGGAGSRDIHPRFFYHLGDALIRLGQRDKAQSVHQLGALYGHFLSADQRSLYNCAGITSREWWTIDQTGQQALLRSLEENWKQIKAEALRLIDSKISEFINESEDLLRLGDWKQFTLYERGSRIKAACDRAPYTCSLIAGFSDAHSCSRGQVKFSILQPGTHVWPHTGPTNCRLRAHLPLLVPKIDKSDTDNHRQLGIRVANDTRTWEEGQVLIFDDSFEHEVWHFASSIRLILIVDFWHPEVTKTQRNELPPI